MKLIIALLCSFRLYLLSTSKAFSRIHLFYLLCLSTDLFVELYDILCVGCTTLQDHPVVHENHY